MIAPTRDTGFHLSILALLASAAFSVTTAIAHEDGFSEKEVSFTCEVAEVAGTLTLPEHRHDEPGGDKTPCVVIVGGTLSHTRDGGLVREGVPKRDALKRLAHKLAESGYASLRYDKVGFGTSKPTEKWTRTYEDEAVVAAAAISFVRSLSVIGKVAAAGESAGAYLLCLAAKAGTEADAYVFLGGHCDSGEAIYQYNFARLVEYAESTPERRKWAEKRFPFELALGRHYRDMFAAAARGDTEFEIVDGELSRKVGLARRKEEIDMPPGEMFKFIKKPALAISGSCDLNVPPDHAARIVSMIRSVGNHSCTCLMLPGLDHNFQIAPENEDLRFQERHTFDSFRREYAPALYSETITWLDETFGRATTSPKLPEKVEQATLPIRAVEQPEDEQKTDSKPARLYLAPGIQIIRDITNKGETTGVGTLEGEIGPLLLGEDSQAYFIDMPAGMYCEEHPHSSESIIYTVRGRWVLCSKGRRHVMKPGTLFHFAPNTPTGYEVPFDEDAFILIFKGQRLTQKEEDFVNYLKGLARRLEREQAAGIPFLLKDLPDDHPAIRYAKEINPDFGK